MDAVERALEDIGARTIAADLLGTADSVAIRAWLRACEPDAVEIIHFSLGVGVTVGVRRADGSSIALKLHKRFADPTYLDRLQLLQDALRTAGHPGVPRPLGRQGSVLREEWIASGRQCEARDPGVAEAVARELAAFVRAATATGIRPRRDRFLLPAGRLWPEPHNARFDFLAGAQNAEWIDEIANEAASVPHVGSEVVGHLDWAVKHLRFDPALRLVAIFDWDSVVTDREPLIAGAAAGAFTYDHHTRRLPTAQETCEFLDAYDVYRGGGAFDRDERRSAVAAAVYLQAYTARCHHAVMGDARKTGLSEYAAALLC